MKKIKIINQVVTTILLLCIGIVTIYATATIASTRRSPYLPWQGVPLGNEASVNPTGFDPAHNVGGNNPAGAYLPDDRFSWHTGSAVGSGSVVYDSTTGLYWESFGDVNTCNKYNTTEVNQKRNTTCTVHNGCNYCAAQEYCETLDKGGFQDWRVPSPLELQTLNVLADPSAPTIYFDQKFFNSHTGPNYGFTCLNIGAWTNATDATNQNNQWVYDYQNLSFTSQSVNYCGVAGCPPGNCSVRLIYIRCVRGPIRL